MIWEIRRTSYTFDREKAVKTYNQLNQLRYQTGKLIAISHRAGIRFNYTLRETLTNLRETYNETVRGSHAAVEIRRRVLGRTVRDTYIPFDGTGTISNAVRNIRDEIRRFRRRNRDFRLCDVYTTRNHYFNRQQQSAYNGKSPNDDGNYIGIELECVVPTDNNLKIELLPWRKYLSIAGDGSICCDDENDGAGCDEDSPAYEGEEYRILARRETVREIVQGVTQTLIKAGASVNKSCGLHVHFDMRNHNADTRELIYSKLYHALPLLKKIVPRSRRDNQYCRINHNNKPSYRGSRYRAINSTAYNRHRTFEIRLFNGTLDAVKILNWIELLTRIMESAPVLRCPASWKTAAKAWGLSAELVAWCEARERKFAPAPCVLGSGTVVDANEGRTDSENPAPLQGAPLPNLVIEEAGRAWAREYTCAEFDAAPLTAATMREGVNRFREVPLF